MNIAVIVASGTGARMGQCVPKQFLSVRDKPVLIYTLESFQKNSGIDDIIVVTLEGWENVVKLYAEQFGISKLKQVVLGGETVQESIRNGVDALRDVASADDLIIIHDGVRPVVNQSVLNNVLKIAKEKGNAVSATLIKDQVQVIDNEESSIKYVDRVALRKVTTPQAYSYAVLKEAYRKAFEMKIGISSSSYTTTMMLDLGHRLYFAKGSDKNLKLTTQEDLDIFKALLDTAKIE
jgi:2-C-methyl-D-erythritol 4-phosphate cytidylyltransferase